MKVRSPRDPTRRSFLRHAATGVGAFAALRTLTAARAARVLGSNEALRIGVIGLNGRGRDHVAGFGRLRDVRVAALCDCDRAVLDRELAASRQRGDDVQAFADPRQLLAAGAVDAVSIATPNHWHALLGVWACEHGLDAYVEKPVSHDVWEGEQLVRAAARHGRVVACGTQCRSNPGMQAAIAWLQSGALGRVKLARGLCYKRRKSIGKAGAPPPPPPAGVDYELWLGPAALQPVQRRRFHYDWHWQWDFGNGDLGNQGVHQMDLCRWGLGQDALPPQAWSFGGRLGYEDDGQTPNTQVVWLGYEPAPIVFEVRGLPARQGSETMDRFLGADVGVVFHCEHGHLALTSYEGGLARDAAGRTVREFGGAGDHFANFVAAVRARTPGALAADARTGHLSASLCHLGNDSWRQGEDLPADAVAERLLWLPEASEAFERVREHLRQNGLPPPSTPLRLGALLRPDGEPGRYPRRAYRAPFVLEPQA